MKRTPRVVIPPPTQKCRKSTVCRREQRVRRRRAPTLRKPFFLLKQPRAGLFRHSHSGRRVVIPPPHRNAEKMQNGSLITSPNRAPAETQRSGFGGKRTSDRESESCRLRRDEGFVVRSDDGQHRICLVCGEAAALPNALGGAWPHTPRQRKVRSVRNTWLAMYSSTPLPCASSPNETRFAGLSFGFRKRF